MLNDRTLERVQIQNVEEEKYVGEFVHEVFRNICQGVHAPNRNLRSIAQIFTYMDTHNYVLISIPCFRGFIDKEVALFNILNVSNKL